MSREARGAAAGLLLSLALDACGGGSDGSGSDPAPPRLSAKAAAGKALFFDTSLSVSGKQSCGTCHVPVRAFTADPTSARGLPVPLGGRQAQQPFISEFEMANADAAEVSARLQASPTTLQLFIAAFGTTPRRSRRRRSMTWLRFSARSPTASPKKPAAYNVPSQCAPGAE